MEGYRNAILRNPGCFKGKTVLDVGTGSGVLSIWAAMAGAKRVYAVEATSMAQHARRLIQQNGFEDVIVVLEGYMEKQTLPEKVDIIVSEWMGYFLLRESMFDSVIAARDTWLKPGGALYPSHAVLRMAPLCSAIYANRVAELEDEIGARLPPWALCAPSLTDARPLDWHVHCVPPYAARPLAYLMPFALRSCSACTAAWDGFGQWMADENGINVAGLSEFFAREQQEYLLQSAQWCQLRWTEVIGDEFDVSEFDCHTISVKELAAFSTRFSTTISDDVVPGAILNAFGGWFDADFNGSASEPAPNPVTLTTSPESKTHWAQQVFMVYPPIAVEAGDVIEGTVKLARQRLNHRLLWVQMVFTHRRPGIGQIGEERTLNFRID
jgi:protein arginine N-methyltransferase 1